MEHNILQPLLKRLSRVPLNRWEIITKPFYTIYVTSLDSFRVSLARHEENYLLTVSEKGRTVFSERSTLVEPGFLGNIYENIGKCNERYGAGSLKRLQKIIS